MKGFYYFLIFAFVFINSSCGEKDCCASPSGELTEITSLSTFESSIKDGVSMVFFHATWCPKCANQRPAVEGLVSEFNTSNVKFNEVNFEKQTSIVEKYDVYSFPTIVIYKDGVEVHRFEGQGHSQKVLSDKLKTVL